MIMTINLEKAKEVLDKNGISFDDGILIKDHYVTVKLGENSGKSYHFFNDIEINPYLEKNGEGDFTGFYTLTFEKKT